MVVAVDFFLAAKHGGRAAVLRRRADSPLHVAVSAGDGAAVGRLLVAAAATRLPGGPEGGGGSPLASPLASPARARRSPGGGDCGDEGGECDDDDDDNRFAAGFAARTSFVFSPPTPGKTPVKHKGPRASAAQRRLGGDGGYGEEGNGDDDDDEDEALVLWSTCLG